MVVLCRCSDGPFEALGRTACSVTWKLSMKFGKCYENFGATGIRRECWQNETEDGTVSAAEPPRVCTCKIRTMTTRERLGIDGRCRRKLWTPESWPGPMWKSTTNDFWENLHHCGESVRRNRRWSSSVRTVCVPTVCMRAGDLVSMTGGMRTARLAAFASHYLDSGATLRGRVVRVTCKPDRHGEHKVASTQKASGLWRQVRFSMRLI